MIIKPSISYASLSISNSSVVHDRESAVAHWEKVMPLNPEGIFIEGFLAGREFTVLITKDASQGFFAYNSRFTGVSGS